MRTFRFLAPVLVGLAIAGCAGAPTVQAPRAQQQDTPPQPAPQAQTRPADGVVPPQGIAVGEPAPGERVAGDIQPASPCIEEFSTLDANGDGYIQLDEWKLVRVDGGAFKAEDTDADGRLDSLEFCQ